MSSDRLRSISFAFLYGFVSVATTILTKFVVSSYGFKFTAVLVLLEKIAIIACLYAPCDNRTKKDAARLVLKTPLLSFVSLINAMVSITSLEGPKLDRNVFLTWSNAISSSEQQKLCFARF